MTEVQSAAAVIRSEARAVGPEWLAGAAMCYVQSRVRGWREHQRRDAGRPFTSKPEDILSLGSGFCGSNVIAWRAILKELGIQTRQYSLMWNDIGHICAEAKWDGAWHFFDIQNGTVWLDDDRVLSWGEIRSNPDAPRVSNAAAIRYAAHDEPFWSEPFAYLTADPLKVRIAP